MKKIVTEDRYEMHGNPLCWIWLFIGAMWLIQLPLRMDGGESGIGVICCGVCAVLSLVSALLWSGYRLIVDETGIELREGWKTHRIAWTEIEGVTVHNKVSFWKSTGITFRLVSGKNFYINKTEILPLVRKYAACPVETEA